MGLLGEGSNFRVKVGAVGFERCSGSKRKIDCKIHSYRANRIPNCFASWGTYPQKQLSRIIINIDILDIADMLGSHLRECFG